MRYGPAPPTAPVACEFAVVLTPINGIPGMWEESGTGTGTQGDSGAGTGTGTAIGDAGDRPGFADCVEYRLRRARKSGKALAHPMLQPTGRIITVYNYRFTAVNGNQFVGAHMNQDGDWFVSWAGDLFRLC